MKWKYRPVIIILIIASLTALIAGGTYYINSVRDSLWKKSVKDVLEVTAQGRYALDVFLEKEFELVQSFSRSLSGKDFGDEDAILQKQNQSTDESASLLCINLSNGMAYSSLMEDGLLLEEEQMAPFLELGEKGIRGPFIDELTGVRTLGFYEQFTFRDGSQGLLQRTQPLLDIADRFSLSFYDDAGFSYVVDKKGDIVIRATHRNSNRTFQNLFDIIDQQGNDEQVVETFRDSMANGREGVARFGYHGEDYVFCYVPVETSENWYVVSIIPDRVIMEQVNDIVQQTRILYLLILVAVLLFSAFFMFYAYSARRIIAAEEKAHQAATAASLAKSQFLSNMSHDIRTPMNAIIGMTELASYHVEEPEKVRDCLKKIKQSGQLLVGLINDILDMSKIESGKMTLNNENASLEELLTNLVSVIQPTVQVKNQSFDIRLHGITHEVLCFDSLRLSQVLINLTSNAMKFTPEGGSIGVDVYETSSQLEGYTHITFRVIDTGIGMQPEFISTIFDSFIRERDSRINKIEGTGLGMAITKMIVTMMKGEIHVESEPGVGSVFTVELDLQLAGEDAQEQLTLPACHILVADDDIATGRSAQVFLEEMGVTADTADDGNSAVEKAVTAHRMEQDYDLILLDWKMPDIDGLEAVRRIRARIGNEVPILIISAYDWASIEQQAIAEGVNGFIQKPYFKSTLYRCVKQYAFHEKTENSEQKAAVSLKDTRILLAEDNEINQQIAVELLQAAGASVQTADNGKICVEMFEQSAPGYFDLILMDVQMPVLNGYKATSQVRALEREDAKTVPIFALTADAFAEDIEEARKAGMNSHLAKPLDINVMLREIQRYTNKK